MKHDTRFIPGRPRIRREVHLPLDLGLPGAVDGENERALTFLVTNTCYTRPSGGEMLEQFSAEVSSDTMGRHFIRRSDDHGESWTDPELWFAPIRRSDGVLRHGESALCYDATHDVVLEVVNEQLHPEGHFTGESKRFTRIVYRCSTDGGRTFTNERPLICHGGDETNWAPGVTYGENCAQVSFCVPAFRTDGRLLLPICTIPKGSDLSRIYEVSWEAGCFIGRWMGTDYVWEAGEQVALTIEESTRGADEPTLAELADGRLLMIMRASNAGRPDVPGRKWYAISSDGGRRWDHPRPLAFASGAPLRSPAAGSQLIRSSRNGRLYWIANIVDDRPDGNRPRYPLQIAEIDEDIPAVRDEAVFEIDTRRPGESELLQLSNFRAYEDRREQHIMVVTSRYQMHGREHPESPAFRYRIDPRRLEAS